jgi:hypothetical protein
MHLRLKQLIWIAAICATPLALQAQQFSVDGHSFQVHGYVSQGFVDTGSGGNNWLTMNTSDGSLAMTEGAVNISTQITDKFRVGAQVYDRDFGQLGKWHPQLDWAVADYRFTSWFGVRAGKVKTTFGLYNDVQDMNFLATPALLPQSIYPTDLRDGMLAHLGGDVYGKVSPKHLGTFSYTGFVGERRDGLYGGYIYLEQGSGIDFTSFGGLQYGGDLRWYTPLKGLLVGYSGMNQHILGTGTFSQFPPGVVFTQQSTKNQTNQFYAQYAVGKFRVDSEYRHYVYNVNLGNPQILWVFYDTTVPGWYLAGAYRVAKRLELGSYYSRMWAGYTTDYPGDVQPSTVSSPDRHCYDKVATARVDLNRYWNVKVEGHFMDGYGNTEVYPGGFYPQQNPQGLKPKTNALVIRTGFNF